MPLPQDKRDGVFIEQQPTEEGSIVMAYLSNDGNQPTNKKRSWNMPNWLAQSRLLAGGDWRAAFLLYRIRQVWTGSKKKLSRFDTEWVAMPRAHWAQSAGLSESEIKNYAIPKLKEHCAEFLRFEAWKLKHDGPKILWVSIDEPALQEAFQHLDEIGTSSGATEYHQPLKGIGYEKGLGVEKKPMKIKLVKKSPLAKNSG